MVGSPPIEHKPSIAEKEFYDFFVQTLGVTSLVLAMLLCYLFSFRMELAEELAFTSDEVLEISGPASRLLAKSKLPATTRKMIVSSGDAVGLSTVMTAYVVRILSLLKQKAANHEFISENERVPVSQQQTNNGHFASGAASLAGFGAFATTQ